MPEQVTGGISIDDGAVEEIVESIKVELGHPIVEIYLSDEQIKVLLGKALRRCASKAYATYTTERTVTNRRVDLTDLDVEIVKNVYMSPGQGFSGFTGFPEFDDMGIRMPGLGGSSINNALVNIGHMAEARRLLVSDYYLDGGILYLDNYSGTIFIEYLSKTITFADLDTEWRSWVESYTSALCKITEGRIRGKYRVNGSPYEIDGDTLRSEGESQRNELESRLEQAFGYWNILR